MVTATDKPRLSNIELLRIVAMMMVLGLHLNYKHSLPPVVTDYTAVNLASVIFRNFLEALCICAANVFVMISGYFGIRPKVRSCLAYLYQCSFFCITTYAAYILLCHGSITKEGLLSCIFLSKNGWFITSYLGLYILSPVINKYLDNISLPELKKTLIAFYLFIFFWGWIGVLPNFGGGHSTLCFIGLYIIGRYLRLSKPDTRTCIALFSSITIAVTIILTICIVYFNGIGVWKVLSYMNPLIVLQAASLLVLFSKLSLKHNRYINLIAKSAFGVYLLHDVAYYQIDTLNDIVRSINSDFCGFANFLMLLSLLIVLFCIGIIWDKVRILSWSVINSLINK